MKKQSNKLELNTAEVFKKFINDIVKSKNNDSLFFFIGAGVSISQGYPTWNDYVNQLIEYWKYNLPVIYKENVSEKSSGNFSFEQLRMLDELKMSKMSKKRKIDYIDYLIREICADISKNGKYDANYYYKKESLNFEKFLFSEIKPIKLVNIILNELMNINASFITTNYDNQIEDSYEKKNWNKTNCNNGY